MDKQFVLEQVILLSLYVWDLDQTVLPSSIEQIDEAFKLGNERNISARSCVNISGAYITKKRFTSSEA